MTAPVIERMPWHHTNRCGVSREVVCVFPVHILCEPVKCDFCVMLTLSVQEYSCPLPVFCIPFVHDCEHFVEDHSLLTAEALGQLARQYQWHVQVHNT